jgi:ABC-type tungstate transport system substrate-binding protein
MIGGGNHGARARTLGEVVKQRPGLLPSRRGCLGLLVFMLGVARGAAGLLNLVFNHRDDSVIGDAALAWTVIVQDVTEPKPALLHELPRKRALQSKRALQVGLIEPGISEGVPEV